MFPRVVVLAMVIVMVAGGCGGPSAPAVSPPVVDTRPVVDTAPYYCSFVPQEAFRRVTGITTRFTDFGNSRWVNGGGCHLTGGIGYGPLSVQWSEIRGDGEIVMKYFHRNYDDENPVRLPREFGEGYVVYVRGVFDHRPYRSISWFHCGKKHPWIGINLERVAPGRDWVKDLTELLRIAKNRYGQWKKCTPQP